MTHLDVRTLSLEPIYDALIPTLKFKLGIQNRSDHDYAMCNLSVGVYLVLDQDSVFMGFIQVPPFSLPRREVKDITFHLPLTIDINNAIFEKLKVIQSEELIFRLKIRGLCMFKSSPSAPSYTVTPGLFMEGGRANTEEVVRVTKLSVEQWRRLLSEYYRNLTWIAISRETYLKLKKIVDKTGYTFDELIEKLLEAWQREQGA